MLAINARTHQFAGNGVFDETGLPLVAGKPQAALDHFFNAQRYGFSTGHGGQLRDARIRLNVMFEFPGDEKSRFFSLCAGQGQAHTLAPGIGSIVRFGYESQDVIDTTRRPLFFPHTFHSLIEHIIHTKYSMLQR